MTDLFRSTRSMALLTVASRLSGFVRIAVFASVFGKTYLANTYQSANTIPNVLFELFAAGALQAVLVPVMSRVTSSTGVGAPRSHAGSTKGVPEDEYVAGAVLGLLSAVLAVVAVAAVALGPQLMGLLAGDITDEATRNAEIELGALFLWFFMPQVLFYGANIVATSVLNAKGSFALPVAAPLANNVIVIVAYLWFGAVHEGPITLDLTAPELWIVAGGTTLGVIAFCSIPVVALARQGFRLRPRLDRRHPVIATLVREGAWAAVFLGATQVLLLVVLRVANRDPGGPVIYQFAFILFTLPHALFAVPIMTTRFPSLSRYAAADDAVGFADATRAGIRGIVFMAMAASAVSVAVARPATELVSFGEAVKLTEQIADATIAFAPGIAGFGLFLFFTRVYYARSDARTPALTNVAVVAASSVAMLTVVAALDPRHLVTGLAAAFAAGQLVGAGALLLGVSRRLAVWGAPKLAIGGDVSRSVGAAVAAGAAGWTVGMAVGWNGRIDAALSTVAGVIVVIGVYLSFQAILGGPMPLDAVRTFGSATRSDPTGTT